MSNREQKTSFERVTPSAEIGLTLQQVEERKAAGAVNQDEKPLTRSVKEIVRDNTLTLFNLLNIVLALVLILVGHLKNTVFLGVAIANTGIGIFQEIRSKRALDRLTLLAKAPLHVVREGKKLEIASTELVLDDIVVLKTGDQVVGDGELVDAIGLEMDESLLTGEADSIRKHTHDQLLSGSFVVAGAGYLCVKHLGQDGFAGKLAQEAKKEKRPVSELMGTVNRIIKILTFIIIPVGIVLLWAQMHNGATLSAAVLGVSAAMIGMIPEGLILLTSVTLYVSAYNLTRKKALVQSLPSIETLARIDTLCLDKTGTITDGELSFVELVSLEGASIPEMELALAALFKALPDENATARSLRTHFSAAVEWNSLQCVAFSSARKWSGVQFEGEGSFAVGAYEYMFTDQRYDHILSHYAQQGYRVLTLAQSRFGFEDDHLPEELEAIGLIILSDHIRDEAAATFEFFKDQGVTLKVISGDNAQTVSRIALNAGIEHAEEFVDMSMVKDDEIGTVALTKTVFGRVSPYQKRELIKALKTADHTVCMTGDGVNDVLALKEADCAVVMVNGSEAARSVADFVLLTSDFSLMIDVLNEGRRVINNIEQVASLYLVKTIYSTVLAIIYMFLPYPYPFIPLQLTPINTLTVGIPSFFLAFRHNFNKPKGQFLINILENSLPAALTIILNILLLRLIGTWFGLQQLEISTMNILLVGAVCFFLLIKVSQPFNTLRKVMLVTLLTLFLMVLLFFYSVFDLDTLISKNVVFYLPALVESWFVFNTLCQWVAVLIPKFIKPKH